jgi:hypothetical protein
MTTIRETIDRDLADEPQSVVKVYETGQLRTDLREYVLTDGLAREFDRVLGAVVESARPAGGETGKIGVWVSGFFGSGKSHFAKLAGHLLADTPVGDDTARALFASLLHSGRPSDERLRGLLQEARTYRLACHLVPFDITALHSAAAERNVGLTFLLAFNQSLGLSSVIPFAERELELQAAGCYDGFVALYERKSGVPWAEDQDVTTSSALFAECLAELLPQRYATPELAHQSLEFALRDLGNLTIEGVIDRLMRWLDARQRQAGRDPQRLVFVADEVGAWAGRDQKRIEQFRSFVENLSVRGRGRIWLMVTSQEKLSAVVQNADIADAKSAQDLLQRLEARFNLNIHLESSEVGTVIQDRILRKKPTAAPALERLWGDHQQQVADIAEPPGLELGAVYPRGDCTGFVKHYPFLPYQVAAAADIFGGMRGIKVSSGARSMIKVVFDATRELADRELGAVVSWDRVFDSANRDNEFADEQYLGSQGLAYIASADRDLPGAPVTASRLLKALWLTQQSPRIPRTDRNLARLLVGHLDANVLELERDVEATLAALAEKSFVRQDMTDGQWRFLTQDEVTVECIVQRIAGELRAREVRDAIAKLYEAQLQSLFPGRITAGKSNTAFEYGLFLNDLPIKNEGAPVTLRAALAGTPAAGLAAEQSAADLEAAVVYWTLPAVAKLEERLRRAIAIERAPDDEEFRQIATERTRREAQNLEGQAAELRRAAAADVERACAGGTLYWAGNVATLEAAAGGSGRRGGLATGTKTKAEEALRDRITAKFYRFGEGDRLFSAANIDKLFTAPAGERARLDPGLGLFSDDGHVHGNHVLIEELSAYLNSSAKTTGQDIAAAFAQPPYGWPGDLLRYVAAAMFVDGKLTIVDRSGKRYDDPKQPTARANFGTAAFRAVRLEIEEDSLTPAESSAARALLTELGQQPSDGGEVALKEATLLVRADLTRRLAVLDGAQAAGLPLPTEYDGIRTTLEGVADSGSRAKIVRSLLAHADGLRAAREALRRLEEFDRRHGFNQYLRSQQLLLAAIQAGMVEDPTWGTKVQAAREEIEALTAQRRVLDEWDGAYARYRSQVLEAYREVYRPLREELRDRVAKSRAAVTGMPEYEQLPIGDRSIVRTRYLIEGRPLAEVDAPALKNEEQLLSATAAYSIPHMRAVLSALASQVSEARALVIERYNTWKQEQLIAAWQPAQAFAGQRFTTEAEIDAAFDAEKERLKTLIREGKTIQVV